VNPGQLDLLEAVNTAPEGFDGWDVFARPTGRGLTVAEFAERWSTPETTARAFLKHFRRVGIAVEAPDGRWLPTREAVVAYRWYANSDPRESA
jgi:DNA-binding IclR family transcriptional regulator